MIGQIWPITFVWFVNKEPQAPTERRNARVVRMSIISSSAPEDDRKYLQIPADTTRHLTSPPCSPIPIDWDTFVEEPPVPWIEEFDLEATEGCVHLGGDKFLDLGTRKVCKMSVRRRGMILSKSIAGQGKKFREDEIAPAQLPPIIVDCYE